MHFPFALVYFHWTACNILIVPFIAPAKRKRRHNTYLHVPTYTSYIHAKIPRYIPVVAGSPPADLVATSRAVGTVKNYIVIIKHNKTVSSSSTCARQHNNNSTFIIFKYTDFFFSLLYAKTRLFAGPYSH